LGRENVKKLFPKTHEVELFYLPKEGGQTVDRNVLWKMKGKEDEPMNRIKIRLLGDGRRGYRQIIRFSGVSLVKGNLIIDCPIRNDALALLRQFGTDLHLIAKRLRVVETIEIKGNGETIYKPHPVGFIFWE
jgi:hypothetical protein